MTSEEADRIAPSTVGILDIPIRSYRQLPPSFYQEVETKLTKE